MHVAVFKELEEVRQPEFATSGAAVFRNDSSMRRFAEPVEGQPVAAGWIPLGNDVRLEQEILARLQQRLGM